MAWCVCVRDVGALDVCVCDMCVRCSCGECVSRVEYNMG